MKVNASKQGVSQVLNRLTYISTLCNALGFKHQQIIPVNLFILENYMVHHGDIMNPTETPEGQAVGVVKNLAMNCEVSITETSEPVRYYIEEYINLQRY